MKQSLSEIKYGFERWLENGAVRDTVRRREILNVCEQVLPWFVRERINPDFDTLYGIENPDEVHSLWHKIKSDSDLKAENAERSPINYTEALRLFENYLRRPTTKGNETIFNEDRWWNFHPETNLHARLELIGKAGTLGAKQSFGRKLREDEEDARGVRPGECHHSSGGMIQ